MNGSNTAKYSPRRLGESLSSTALLVLLIIGCGGAEEAKLEKRPRPVTVQILSSSPPPNAALSTAAVGSWKQEDVGFEVSGRVEFVVEQNTEIEGRITARSRRSSGRRDADQLKARIAEEFGDQLVDSAYVEILQELLQESTEVVIPGTQIGRLESERYELQFQRALAAVRQAQNNLDAGLVDLEEGIPAQIASADASQKLAQLQLNRSKQLVSKNAAAQSDVDKDQANFDKSVAEMKRLEALQKAKEAEVEGLRASVLKAKQDLKDAHRNLKDCVLYSSFTGQISDVDVVPGSVVSAGQAIATLQMMDPIKVELEVSTEQSRLLRNKEHLPVHVQLPDGSTEVQDGFLYLIDPVADPLTRTYTITLLVLNRKLATTKIPDGAAATNQTWRLDFGFLPGAKEGMLFIAKEALRKDDQGFFLWAITNTQVGQDIPDNGQLKVRRLPVTPGANEFPYLGHWVFQEIKVNDENFDPSKNLVAGKLTHPEEGADQWKGDTIQLDSGSQWMLRPGDLVKVDLSGNNRTNGFYVSMDSIVHEDGSYSIFQLDESDDATVVRKVPIRFVDGQSTQTTSGLRRIEAIGEDSLEGTAYVTSGVHYLVDGETVRPVKGEEAK